MLHFPRYFWSNARNDGCNGRLGNQRYTNSYQKCNGKHLKLFRMFLGNISIKFDRT